MRAFGFSSSITGPQLPLRLLLLKRIPSPASTPRNVLSINTHSVRSSTNRLNPFSTSPLTSALKSTLELKFALPSIRIQAVPSSAQTDIELAGAGVLIIYPFDTPQSAATRDSSSSEV